MAIQLLRSIPTPGDGTTVACTPASVLVTDVDTATRLRAEREATELGRYDEVWEGVYVVSPSPNNSHQWLIIQLSSAFVSVLDVEGGDRVYGGMNVSDREEGWVENYRIPDIAVVLAGNDSKDCETHLCGGPDFLVEILSRNDLARQKREFYAHVGVRELLIVDRFPWALELYSLEDGRLGLVGTSTAENQVALLSTVLPLQFRLVPGPDRPRIEVTKTESNQSWLI